MKNETHANPENAATDPKAAAQQEQVKEDHDALQESARRVESTVSSSVRDTPVQPSNFSTSSETNAARTTGDANTAHENANAARDSARRVEESVSGRDERNR